MSPERGAAAPRFRFLLAALVCLLFTHGAAYAQVRPDTARRDTVARPTIAVPIPPQAVEPDTLPPDSVRLAAQDTATIPSFPRFPEPLPTGWAFSRWEWGPEALARYQGLSILEFLERTPGLTIIRGGDHGYPVGITALGLGGGRVRVFLDGFELDPLGYTSFDLQQMGTIDLESVRIDRELGGIRIELNTVRLGGKHPFSAVEAGTGVYESKLVRGILVRGLGRRSILTAAYDAATTQGFGFASPFSLASARASWSYAVSARTGVQLEVRKTGVERLGGAYPENADHRILLLRARSELRPGLVVDAALGRAWRKPVTGDLLSVPLSSTQGMLRGSYSNPLGRAEASLRLRDHELTSSSAPRLELATLASVRPSAWLTAEGELRTARLGGSGGVVWQGTLRGGRVGAPSAFVSVSGGSAGVGLVRDSVVLVPATGTTGATSDTLPFFSAFSSGATALRVGAEVIRVGLTAGIAGVTLAASRNAPFGTAFDRGLPAFVAAAASGIEAHAAFTAPRTRGLLQLEGWGTYWTQHTGRPYLPQVDARGAAILHSLFYSGQLEPTVRFEVAHRGSMEVPIAGTSGAPARSVSSTPYTLTNLAIQIRILNVQAFGRWDNFLDYRQAADLPGVPLPGQRLIYGIRWIFYD